MALPTEPVTQPVKISEGATLAFIAAWIEEHPHALRLANIELLSDDHTRQSTELFRSLRDEDTGVLHNAYHVLGQRFGPKFIVRRSPDDFDHTPSPILARTDIPDPSGGLREARCGSSDGTDDGLCFSDVDVGKKLEKVQPSGGDEHCPNCWQSLHCGSRCVHQCPNGHAFHSVCWLSWMKKLSPGVMALNCFCPACKLEVCFTTQDHPEAEDEATAIEREGEECYSAFT